MSNVDGLVAGWEASAASILTRAVEMDGKQRFSEAIICYREGSQLLMDVVIRATDEAKKSKLRSKAEEYIKRAEKLKEHIDKQKLEGKYHVKMAIENDSIGYSYEKIFGKFLDDLVRSVDIEDPYIRNVHQTFNLLRFCELLVKKCKNLRVISLKTVIEEGKSGHEQLKRFDELQQSLTTCNVAFNYENVKTLHDREIRIDTGWIIQIGRGLDYFKRTDNQFCIGYCDFDLRRCHETTINIFHKDYVKQP